jgi:hypothetical protein
MRQSSVISFCVLPGFHFVGKSLLQWKTTLSMANFFTLIMLIFKEFYKFVSYEYLVVMQNSLVFINKLLPMEILSFLVEDQLTYSSQYGKI